MGGALLGNLWYTVVVMTSRHFNSLMIIFIGNKYEVGDLVILCNKLLLNAITKESV